MVSGVSGLYRSRACSRFSLISSLGAALPDSIFPRYCLVMPAATASLFCETPYASRFSFKTLFQSVSFSKNPSNLEKCQLEAFQLTFLESRKSPYFTRTFPTSLTVSYCICAPLLDTGGQMVVAASRPNTASPNQRLSLRTPPVRPACFA